MHDPSDFESPPVPVTRIVTFLCALGAANGALVGGVEVLALSQSLTLQMTLREMAELSAAILLVDAAVGALVAFPPALWAKIADYLPGRLGRAVGLARRYQVAFTLGVFALVTTFLAPFAVDLWRTERQDGAAGMLGLVLLITVTAWFNCGFWFRRWLVGAGPALGYRVIMPVVAVLLAGIGIANRGPSGPKDAVLAADQPNLILVSIDTLRRDHVGVYGGPAPTPTMDALGLAGLIFDDAITTIPETLPSHAAMLTGFQPARTSVLSNGHRLSRGYPTVTEQLAAGGYRTGAFVSSFAVDGDTGLDQGFQVYDDDFFPALRGLTSARIANAILPLLMRFADPADFPFLLERGSPETLRRALAWTALGDAQDPRPTFLWVHLFDPHAPYEPREGFALSEGARALDHRAILAQEPGYLYKPEEVEGLRELYRLESAYVDTQVKSLLDGLEAQGLLKNAMIVVVADHGESLGEHNIYFNHHGIYDEVLRVPFLVWTSRMGGLYGSPVNAELGARRFTRTVSTADVANTLLGFSGVSPLIGTQSTNLLGFVSGAEATDTSLTVQGRDSGSLLEGQLCGVRAPNAKYIRRQDGTELFFDLETDPSELVDVAQHQPEALAAGRAGTVICGRTLATVEAPGVDDCARMKALGYVIGDCEP